MIKLSCNYKQFAIWCQVFYYWWQFEMFERGKANGHDTYYLLCFCSVLCLLCLCTRLFICALWSPAGKGLTSWLSFVVSNCEFVTFQLVSWVRCGTWLYRFLIVAPLLTLVYILKYVSLISVTYVDGAHWNSLIEAIPMCTYNICQFNKWVFFAINFFQKILYYFLML